MSTTANPGTPPDSGSTFGPFQLGRRLGEGPTGVVYEAIDTGLRRQAALKVFDPEVAADPGFRENLTRAVEAQGALASEHVVGIHSLGEADGWLYVASELVHGWNLERVIEEYGPPPRRLALDLVAQVATGLADTHDAGLAHHSLAADHVLVEYHDHAVRVFLTGFGLAPPSSPDGGEADDVRALGELLWRCLGGTALADGDPAPAVPQTGPQAAAVNRILRATTSGDGTPGYRSVAGLRDDLRAASRLPDDPSSDGPHRAGTVRLAPPRKPAPSSTDGVFAATTPRHAPPAPLFRPEEPAAFREPSQDAAGARGLALVVGVGAAVLAVAAAIVLTVLLLSAR